MEKCICLYKRNNYLNLKNIVIAGLFRRKRYMQSLLIYYTLILNVLYIEFNKYILNCMQNLHQYQTETSQSLQQYFFIVRIYDWWRSRHFLFSWLESTYIYMLFLFKHLNIMYTICSMAVKHELYQSSLQLARFNCTLLVFWYIPST